MSTMHTPGPWVARPDPNGGPRDWCIGLADDGMPIDHIAVCNERDAYVIAAAPTLLSSLEFLLAWATSEIHNEYDGTSMLAERLAELAPYRAVIAKATGEAA